MTLKTYYPMLLARVGSVRLVYTPKSPNTGKDAAQDFFFDREQAVAWLRDQRTLVPNVDGGKFNDLCLLTEAEVGEGYGYSKAKVIRFVKKTGNKKVATEKVWLARWVLHDGTVSVSPVAFRTKAEAEGRSALWAGYGYEYGGAVEGVSVGSGLGTVAKEVK